MKCLYVELNFPAIVTPEFFSLFDQPDIAKNIDSIFQNNSSQIRKPQ